MKIFGPLSHLKVLEISNVLAGPLVGSYFSENGALVTKIENTNTNGDITRQWNVKENDSTISAYYASANYGKESLFLNLKDPDDYKQLVPLIQQADIIVSNYKCDSALTLKIDFDTLRSLNAKAIIGHISGYGSTNPKPAFDIVLQAESGLLYLTGNKNESPAKIPIALVDIMAAQQLKVGLMQALYLHQLDGIARTVTVSLFDSALAMLINQATNWLMDDIIPQRMGTQHPNICPYGDLFSTRDNLSFILAIGTDRKFERLCSVLDIPIIGFETNVLRLAQRAALHQLLQEQFHQINMEMLEQLFEKNSIPYGRIRDMQEVFSLPEAKELILSETIEGRMTHRAKSSVFKILEQ